ncbi:serine hydrolase [Mucilaginibacter conchicola]|nr:serine hydrolase [Mucilaginibacter conchicola]
MKRLIYFILLSISVMDSFAQQAAVRQIDSAMQLAHQRGIFNGNILVAVKGKVIYERSLGYADGTKTTPLNLSMKFDIGSISKEFNGVAIMLLSERGKLSLDDSLAKFFPEFPAWAKTIKLKQLINYTSGIPALGPAADSTDALVYQSLLKLNALAAQPGTVYIYNHVNVVLQRRIIEKVSGLSYAEFIRKNLLQPAGMNASLVDYPVNGFGMAKAFDQAGRPSDYATGVTGWVRLPVRDLYEWTRALHSGKLISEKSLKLLAESFPGGESSLGTTGYEGDRLIWHQHQGSNYNHEAAFYTNLPEDITIVMMTNNQQMKVWPLKTTILNILHHQPYTVPKKSLYLTIRDRMLDDVNVGLAYYRQLKATGQERYDFSFEIGDLISTGKYLQRRNKYDEAIKVLQTAVQLQARNGDLSYGYELIGDCYQEKGDLAQAAASYRKAVELSPENKNAAGRLQAIEKKAK